MKILVTGGAGFVGTNLIKRLLSNGFDVTSLDNYFTGKRENELKGCKYIKGDIRLDFEKAVGNCDIVFHLAAIARIQPSFKDPKSYFNTNANGTLNVVEFCCKNDIPLIYAGSSSHHSGKYKNPYTFSKWQGEQLCEMYKKI